MEFLGLFYIQREKHTLGRKRNFLSKNIETIFDLKTLKINQLKKKVSKAKNWVLHQCVKERRREGPSNESLY